MEERVACVFEAVVVDVVEMEVERLGGATSSVGVAESSVSSSVVDDVGGRSAVVRAGWVASPAIVDVA